MTKRDSERPYAFLAALLLASGLSACGDASRDASSPHIVTTDVHNFVGTLDQLSPSDTTCV